MSTAEPQASSEGGTEPPGSAIIGKLDDITVGMRVEAKDSYGKWFCAKVVEKDEETQEVMVHFDGWSSRYDELIHIGVGRLRSLSQEQLKKSSRTRKQRPVEVGDRVQAKWQDGRMYYGRILKLLNQMAVVLFDDGVEYTAPISAVRKRKADPSPVSRGEGCLGPGAGVVSERKRRLIERRARDDSTSQPSTSPPSSPLFAPKRHPSSQFWETDESSCTESDEEGSKGQKRDSSPTYCPSSDGDLQPPHSKRGKYPYKELREPYKLRKQLSRQQYAPVVRKRKSKESASSSAGETAARPASDAGSGREGTTRQAGPSLSVVKKERVEEEDTQPPWKSSDEDTLAPGTIDETADNCESGGIKKEGSDTGVRLSLEPDSPDLRPKLPPSSPPPPSSSSPPPSSPTSKQHSSPSYARNPAARDSSNEPVASSSSPSAAATKSPSKLKTSGPLSSRRKSSCSSVTTRFRAQTTFENSKLGKRKERGRPGKVAPKELVIVWDHNEFKCTYSGCTKSFRKQSLLESHMKHYHDIMPAYPRRGKTANTVKLPQGERTPVGKSPQSPSTGKSPKTTSPASLPSSSHQSPTTSASLPLSPALEPTPKKAKLSEEHTVFQEPSGSGTEKIGPLATEATAATKTGGSSTSAGVGSKSPKKSRPKLTLSKSTGAVSLSTSGPQKNTKLSSSHHTPSHHPSPSSSPPSKQKQSSGKKHREKPTKETSLRKGGETGSKSQTSPSLPSSSAAGLPLQRGQTATGNYTTTAGGQKVPATSGGDLSKHDGMGSYDVRVEPNLVLPQVTSAKGEGSTDSRTMEHLSRSTSPSSEANDDVVHCVCGDDTDEGFMIQCEQCLCWQHGDCIGISKVTLPKQYLCCFCTNPPGLRQNRKYQYDLQWYCNGTLPSLPGGPKFPCPEAMLKCHSLLDKLYLLRKMSHSSKVKLQAASTPNHAYLRQWSKECACLDKEALNNYLATALQPIVVRGPENTQDTAMENPTGCTTDTLPIVKSEKEAAEGAEGASRFPEEGKLTNGDGILKFPRDSPPETHKSTGSVKMSVLAGPMQTHVTHKASVPKSGDTSHDSVVIEPKTADISGDAGLPDATEGKLRLTSSEPDFTSEFGVQEMSVFAVKESENVPQLNSPQQQKPPDSPPTKTSGEESTLPPPPLPAIPTVPLLKPLQQSTRSAFKPVVITPGRQTIVTPSPSPGSVPKTPTCTSSQLTSLLTSPISSHPQSLVQPPTSSSSTLPTYSDSDPPPPTPTTNTNPEGTTVSAQASIKQPPSQTTTPTTHQPCATQLSRLKLVPNINGDLSFAETASSLQQPVQQDSPSAAPVLLRDFTEAFVHGDTTNWFKRMLLLDHIEAVQDGVLRWVEQMEKEVDELSGEESEEAEDVITGIQATLDQLNTFRCQIVGKTQ